MDVNEKELRQLQTALKNHEAVTFCRKAPRQFALIVDFRGNQYRIDFAYGWQAGAYKSPSDKSGKTANGPDLAELQALIPVILKVQQDKEAEAIAKEEAAKVKAEEDRKTAETEAADQKKKTEELREYCRLTVVPNFHRQSWCENRFGSGKWSINKLGRQELEILAAEIKRRVEEEAIALAAGEEVEEDAISTPCPNCEGSGLCGGLIDGCECMGDCPNDDLCPECGGKGAIVQNSCMDEKEIGTEELAKELALLLPADQNVSCKILWSGHIRVYFPGESFTVGIYRTDGRWAAYDNGLATEGWSLRFNTCKVALSQACASIITRKQKHAEALRMAPEQVAELMRRSKAGDEEADRIILNAMNECLGARCDEAFKPETLTIKGKALTLKQPWAWAIFNCGKNIENRSWDTSYRGRLFIHAGQAYDHSGAAWIAEKFGVEVPGPGNLPEGAIVGWVELAGVTQVCKLDEVPWAIAGHFHWVLKNPQSCEPIPYQGRLGLWPVEIPFPTPPQWLLDNAQAIWAGNTERINGEPYRPSNGSEGDWFMGGWCEQCSRLNSCSIPVMSMAGEQPSEWVYWDQKPVCLAWDEAIAHKPLAYYPYRGYYKVGDSEGYLEEFESAEEAIAYINGFPKIVKIPAEAKTGKSLAFYQIVEEVVQ